MAAWALIPDKLNDGEHKPARFGAFLTTLIAFFLVEMGDKTQVATIALGARFHDVLAVTTGTTLGMMLANVPAVFLGHEVLKYVPLKIVRMIAAGLFRPVGSRPDCQFDARLSEWAVPPRSQPAAPPIRI